MVRTLCTVCLLFTIVCVGVADSEVYHSRESALELAFADADTVIKHELFLSKEDVRRVEELARAELSSRLVTTYVGEANGKTLGYAFIETHQVRTLPETILIVVGADGSILGVHMLAFHEPPEYGPAGAWLGQFGGRRLTDDLSLRGNVAGIAGATLTATAITAAVRRTLAVFEVAIGSKQAETPSAGISRQGR